MAPLYAIPDSAVLLETPLFPPAASRKPAEEALHHGIAAAGGIVMTGGIVATGPLASVIGSFATNGPEPRAEVSGTRAKSARVRARAAESTSGSHAWTELPSTMRAIAAAGAQ